MEPELGDVVIYRNSDGVDMPAIVTAVIDGDVDGGIHLHPFPPPGSGADILSHQWGVARADEPEEAEPRTWRPREPRP